MKLAYLLALLPVVAFATDKKPEEPQNYQQQFQLQHQDQQQSQSASANNEGVSQAVNFRDRLQAPASFSPSIAPTAPCYYSASGGLSIPGGSIGGGKAFLDEDCQYREQLRVGYQIGLVREAWALWCARYGQDLKNCGKYEPAPAPEPVPTVIVLQGDGCARDEKLKRVLDKCVSK